MKKNKRANIPVPPVSVERRPLLSKKSLGYIGGGILMLVMGYAVLSFADSKAQNFPGKVSPFLILGGYSLIGVGLFIRGE